MQEFYRKVYLYRSDPVAPIVIAMDSQLQITVELMDYTIPQGASAESFSKGLYSKKAYYQRCIISGNRITFTPIPGFFVYGKNLLQYKINNGVISLAIEVDCRVSLPESGEIAEPNQVKPMLQRAEEAANDAAGSAKEALQSKNAAAGSAGAAAGSAEAAEESAKKASESKEAAEGSADAAGKSAEEALQSKNAAAGSAKAAKGSQDAAAGSAQAAQEALEKNQAISVNPAYIGDNGNWFVWNTDQDSYVDSGVKAQGPQGIPGTGKVSSVCDVTPGDDGNVALTAENVGARPKDWMPTAQDVGAVAKNDLLSKTYPVGAIYLSASSTSPASLFGGTWERLKDRFLLAAGDNYDAGSTGGEATHTLTVAEMPSHDHQQYVGALDGSWGTRSDYQADGNFAGYPQGMTGGAGGSQPHNNMPPYLAVYMWKRVA